MFFCSRRAFRRVKILILIIINSMEGDANQMSQSPSLCRSGCGFYGSPKTDGLCSKCYKDAVKRKQSNPAPAPIAGRSSPTVATSIITASATAIADEKLVSSKDLSTASPTVPSLSVTPPSQDREKQESSIENEPASPCANASNSSSIDSDSQQEDSLQKEPKKKNRCHVCRKKVGLTGFSCRCSGLFCSLHRYSNEHNCTFDYKELGAKEIRKNNPLVVGEKVQKI